MFYFVQWQRWPSRRERSHEPVDALRILRHWDKLTVRDSVLYCTSKAVLSKNKTYQYVVPSALKEKVVRGICDVAVQGDRCLLAS